MRPTHLARLIDTLIALFDPVVQAIENPDSAEALLRDIGYKPPAGVAFLDDFSPLLGALMDVADQADEVLRGDAEPDYLALVRSLLDALRDVIGLVRDIGATLQANFSADFLAATDIAAQFPRQLADYLVVKMLERQYPVLHSSLLVCGVIDEGDVATAPTPFHTPYKKRVVRWDKIGGYVSSPLSSVQEAYGWDTDDFDYGRLVDNVHRFGQTLGFFSSLTSPEAAALRAFHGGSDVITDENAERLFILTFPLLPVLDAGVGIEIYPLLNAAGDKVAGLGVGVYFDPAAGLEFPITDRLTLRIKYAGAVPLDAGVSILPGLPLQQVGSVFGGAATQADLSVFTPEFGFADADQKTLLLDTPLVKLDFASSAVRGGVLPGVSGFYAETALEGATLTLGTSEGDGFLRQVLPAEPMSLDFSLTLGFSSKTGLYFGGSSALEVQLPAHVEIGPVALERLTLAAKLDAGTIPTSVGVNLRANLGPLVAVVENIGVTATFSFPPENKGNLGPLNFDLGFKPPNGVGLSLDVGVARGGGYVFFDLDREEYAGVLELAIADIVTVKAIGLITTRMPDGSKGFSLLIIITAEFGTGIQLGFGFTLLGLGGLLGLNRTMNLPPLVEGVRTGAVNSIMFPENPVANAPRIISDLRIIFPPYEGRFLIGPMAKLGWGTPALVTASLGIIIEITGNIAIVGVLKVALPTSDAPLIVIQANFVGAIEFDKQRLYFFAALFESRIVFLTLEGELGLLVAWGPDANFVLSAGGFHPRFNPPPLPFPAPRRISVSLLNTSLARIRTETYFAVTSNTVQFGSNTEVMFDVEVARVDGHLSFDALFRFSPFYFVIEVSASVSLKVFGIGLFGIRLHFELSGPSPYRAHGTGSISFFFFDVSADFDITWGDTQDTTLPPLPVMPLLQAEFAKAENWKAELPPQNNLLVSLRKLPESESAQVLHPLGALRVSQRAVPFDLKIDKVGSQKPSDANQYRLTSSTGLMRVGDAPEQYAKAQFLDMSDAEKLSQRAFDPLNGGLLLASGTQQLGATHLTKRRVRYEEIIIDTNYLRFHRRFKIFTRGFFDHFLKGGAVTKSALSNQYKSQLDPFVDKLTVTEGDFTVAHTENNQPFSAQAHFASEAQAKQYLDAQVAARPELHEALHVIPQYEAAA